MTLQLGPHDNGTAVLLLLQRRQRLRLLPLLWELNVPTHGPPLPGSFQANAVDAAALDLALADLYRDGWQLHGQLTVTFTGIETTADFWRPLHARLWQHATSAVPEPPDTSEDEQS